MKRLAEHLDEVRAIARPRIVYTDLDGTLLGPGGSLYASGDGVTSRAAEALAALHRNEVGIVPVSGRTEPQVRDVARALGAAGFIAELGAVTWTGEDLVRAWGPEGPPPFRAMARSGAAALLLDAYAGRLEPHDPWAHADRQATMLFRGHVDLAEARGLLARSGYAWVALHNNGVIPRSYPALDVTEVHAYHLAPAGVDKAWAIGADVARRGLARVEAIVVGDSPTDVAAAPSVGAAFVVANGRLAVEASGSRADNVYWTEAPHGDGFAEAVLSVVPVRS